MHPEECYYLGVIFDNNIVVSSGNQTTSLQWSPKQQPNKQTKKNVVRQSDRLYTFLIISVTFWNPATLWMVRNCLGASLLEGDNFTVHHLLTLNPIWSSDCLWFLSTSYKSWTLTVEQPGALVQITWEAWWSSTVWDEHLTHIWSP